MTQSFAIAAVTETLQKLITQGIKGTLPDEIEISNATVSTTPLDKARNGNGNQINLFLYQTEMNAAWRNMDMPRQAKPGESGHPPLALNLYYLITAYGENDNDVLGHMLLGRVMNILHDYPLLAAQEIETTLFQHYQHKQIERIRITPQPVSLDEMSKLWSSFQTHYRLSAAYQVSVVLIESTRPTTAALPVLSRGSGDQGASILASPSPVLFEVRPKSKVLLSNNATKEIHKPSAEFGDTLSIRGENLCSEDVMVRFRNVRLTDPIDEINPLSGSTMTEIAVELPKAESQNDLSKWSAGFYTLSLVIKRSDSLDKTTSKTISWTTNEVPFALAPKITKIAPLEAPRGNVMVAIECIPQVRPEQRVVLLFEDQEIPMKPFLDPGTPLTFQLTDVHPRKGEDKSAYVLRLRVDGVDSIPVDFTTTPPQFDKRQQITITKIS